MANYPTPHIEVKDPSLIAKTVLMPGDPLRAKFIAENFLTDVVERTKILRKEDGKIYFTEDEENWVELPEDVNVSMNCWCFPASFIDEIETHFKKFLDDALVNNPLKGEFYLPFIVKDMLAENKCTVKVLETTAKWFGVTYKEDKPVVVKVIQDLKLLQSCCIDV